MLTPLSWRLIPENSIFRLTAKEVEALNLSQFATGS